MARRPAKVEYASDVFPIGAIGVAQNDDEPPIFLGERFSLALLLDGQQPSVDAACPARWYLAIPDAAQLASISENQALVDALDGLKPVLEAESATITPQRQSPNLGELKKWLHNRERSDEEPFVFTYIGHHDDGRLFLKQDSPGIQAGKMFRDFKGSSIAILNACNSAMRRVSSGTPIGRLALLKVASTIATTSKISGKLAAAYLDCLNQVLIAPAPLTIGQAHALTTQCLWSREQGAAVNRYYAFKGAALKYVLIGNPHQRICAPKKEPSP